LEECDEASKVTDGDITRRIPFACWINRATEVRRAYISFPQQKLLGQRTSMLHLYEHCLPSYYFWQHIGRYWPGNAVICFKIMCLNYPAGRATQSSEQLESYSQICECV